MEHKECKQCNHSKPLTEFSWNKKSNKYSRICKECQKEKRSTEEAKEKQRHQAYMAKYGISIQDYNQLMTAQGSCCKVCGIDIEAYKQRAIESNSRKWKNKTQEEIEKIPLHFVVDHDHVTGNVRGLTCHQCNIMLGMGKDQPEVFRKAAEYIEESQYYTVNGVKLKRKQNDNK